jgi:hypothetical protein
MRRQLQCHSPFNVRSHRPSRTREFTISTTLDLVEFAARPWVVGCFEFRVRVTPPRRIFVMISLFTNNHHVKIRKAASLPHRQTIMLYPLPAPSRNTKRRLRASTITVVPGFGAVDVVGIFGQLMRTVRTCISHVSASSSWRLVHVLSEPFYPPNQL